MILSTDLAELVKERERVRREAACVSAEASPAPAPTTRRSKLSVRTCNNVRVTEFASRCGETRIRSMFVSTVFQARIRRDELLTGVFKVSGGAVCQ